jgi:hypothetical protein
MYINSINVFHESLSRDHALSRIALKSQYKRWILSGEEFLVSVWDRCHPSIVNNLGSY